MRTFLAVVLASVLGCASTRPTVSIDGLYGEGHVTGFVQIPRAGAEGSTSHERPTLREVGIHDAQVVEGEARVALGPNAAYVGILDSQPSGSAILGSDLVSQGTTFPAGSPVRERLTLDWFRAGYERAFGTGALTLAPSIGFNLLRFQTSLTSPAVPEHVNRGFTHGSLLLGLRGRARLGALEVEARGFLSPELPLRNRAIVYAGEVLLKLHVAFLAPFVGVGYARFEVKDTEQPLHNDVRVAIGPFLLGGLELGF